METIITGFMHVRSTVGIARHIRRIARRLYRLLCHIKKVEEKDLPGAVEKGDVPLTEEEWKTLLGLYSSEEEKIADIVKGEEIELREMRLLEEEDKKDVMELDRKLKGKFDEETIKRFREVLDPFFKNLIEISKKLTATVRDVRREQHDLCYTREHMMRYEKITKEDPNLAVAIRRIARDERRAFKILGKEESALEKFEREFTKAVNEANPEKLEKVIREIADESGKLKETMLRELDDIKELVHDADIIHMHLLKKVRKEAPEKFDELAREGFPKDELKNTIVPEHRRLLDIMHTNLYRLYRMAFWETDKARDEVADIRKAAKS